MGAAVEIGDKLHIMTRRLFEEDVRRHFVGEVTAVSDALVEIRGYTFIFHSGSNEYKRLPEERTRLFSLGGAGQIVNKIPRSVDVSSIVYRTIEDRLVISDGRSFSLPVNEFGSAR
ncbi:MAG: hypothetical protein JRE43_04775 [Deltaproteobacteria bacterium]|jgi:hypothetical protein|nr:hypothetical protein [Deltaproteobacteria bacterium]MBW2540961.1 hypothetical protein [Deltaproteobacteria bacterium]